MGTNDSGSAPINAPDFSTEVGRGERFEFGKNWRRFLSVLDNARIAEAELSLQKMLGVTTLQGKTFLDVGNGSGLFSLAAMRLGAAKVHSFDYDPQSVACAIELKRRYYAEAANWQIERGSALDSAYLQGLGKWDVVYSWGVLHHTGDMWTGLQNVVPLVQENGQLFISIYNDQGGHSKRWRLVKTIYNKGVLGRVLVSCICIPYFVLGAATVDVLRQRNPLARYRDYRTRRGMSTVHDWFDWLGGYPFEVAKPEQVFDFYRARGFIMERLATCGGKGGCNEFVFRKQ